MKTEFAAEYDTEPALGTSETRGERQSLRMLARTLGGIEPAILLALAANSLLPASFGRASSEALSILAERLNGKAPRLDETAFAASSLEPFIESLEDWCKNFWCKNQRARLPEISLTASVSLDTLRDALLVSHIKEHLLHDRIKNQDKSLLARTQFFTPPDIARLLVEESDFEPGRMTLLDPACGAGNLLVAALEGCISKKFFPSQISVEAKNRTTAARLEDTENRDLAGHIEKFLVCVTGLDIDAELLNLARLALYLAARKYCAGEFSMPNLCLLDSPLGSLELPEGLSSRRFDVVLMNPPYQSRRTMDATVKNFMDSRYEVASGDLYTAFIWRAVESLAPGGRLCAITQQSFLSIRRYAELRRQLNIRGELASLRVLGTGVFSHCPGEKVNSAVFTYIKGDAAKADADCLMAPEGTRDVLNRFCQLPTLAEQAGVTLTNGLFTCNNAIFVKEADAVLEHEAHLYVPYDKGGGRKWYHESDLRLLWLDEGNNIRDYRQSRGQSRALPGERFYFKSGITYSYIGTSGFRARLLSPGSVFDVASSSIFSSELDLYYLLGWLNSSLIIYLLGLYNPTVNFQIGDLRRLPFAEPDQELVSTISSLARLAVDTCRLRGESAVEEYIQEEIDDAILNLYHCQDLRDTINASTWVVNSRKNKGSKTMSRKKS